MAELDLTGIGTASELFETKGNSPLEKFLIQWLDEKVVELKGELRETGRVATGSLEQSLAVEVLAGLDMNILANDYWDFINEGVDGTKKKWGSPYSFKSLKSVGGIVANMKTTKWAATKGLFPNNGQSFDSMLYAIAVGVKKQGIKPSHFFDTVMTDEAINEFTNQLADQFEVAIANLTFPDIPSQ